MYYDITIHNSRTQLIKDSAIETDECPVDDICDSIPNIIKYIQELEGKIRELKSQNQQLQAKCSDYERRVNNLKSQKQRRLKKKGK